jgi:hypothetical protein
MNLKFPSPADTLFTHLESFVLVPKNLFYHEESGFRERGSHLVSVCCWFEFTGLLTVGSNVSGDVQKAEAFRLAGGVRINFGHITF